MSNLSDSIKNRFKKYNQDFIDFKFKQTNLINFNELNLEFPQKFLENSSHHDYTINCILTKQKDIKRFDELESDMSAIIDLLISSTKMQNAQVYFHLHADATAWQFKQTFDFNKVSLPAFKKLKESVNLKNCVSYFFQINGMEIIIQLEDNSFFSIEKNDVLLVCREFIPSIYQAAIRFLKEHQLSLSNIAIRILKHYDFESNGIQNYKLDIANDLFNQLQHELLNPLFGIELITTQLMDEVSDDEQKLTLEQINISSKHALNTIQHFKLSYSQNSNDNSHVELITNAINHCFILAKSITSQINKKIVCDDQSLNDFPLKLNLIYFSQIIFNLIINSAQSINQMPSTTDYKGSIFVFITRTNSNIKISIADNGRGIDQSHLEQIFLPYYSTKKFGSGLGLSISKQLAKKIGGNLYLDKPIDKFNTVFSLELPYE